MLDEFKKYNFQIGVQLKRDLIERTPSAAATYILAGVFVGFTGYTSVMYKPIICFFGFFGAAVSILRIILARKILKEPELINSKTFQLHHLTIYLNAIAWSVIFNLVLLGNTPGSIPFALTFMVTLAIAMGGISSLSPAPRVQTFFFAIVLLVGSAVFFYQAYFIYKETRYYTFPVLMTFAFFYCFSQSKRFYGALIQLFTSQNQLKTEKDHLQTVIDSVPGFLIYLDSKLSILSITKNLNFTFGDSFVSGKNVTDSQEQLAVIIKQFNQSGLLYKTTELELKTSEGGRWYLTSFYKTKDTGEIIIVAVPISELVLAREELADQTNKAMNASKLASLGEMAAGAAHEINNPVAIIYGYVTEIKRMIVKPDPVPKNELEIRMEKAAKALMRIKKIVGGMRLLSRDADADPFDPTPFSSIVEDTLSLCQERFVQNQIEFKIDPIPDIKIECRATQVSQVILNLLNNAFDAVEKTEKKTIQLKFEQKPSSLKVVVKDNGPGVPTENLEKIFDPFFTTKEPGKGTGLGLSISRRIMSTHQGTIAFINNNGAELHLEFPLTQK